MGGDGVRLQLCFLARALVCQAVLHLIKLAKLLQMSEAPVRHRLS